MLNLIGEFFTDSLIIGIKTCLIVYLFVLSRATLARARYDQLMNVCWTHLLPVALGSFIFILCLIVGFDIIPEQSISCLILFCMQKDYNYHLSTPYSPNTLNTNIYTSTYMPSNSPFTPVSLDTVEAIGTYDSSIFLFSNPNTFWNLLIFIISLFAAIYYGALLFFQLRILILELR